MLKLLREIKNKDGAHLKTSAHVRFQTLQKHTHCMQAAHVHACNTLVHPNTLKTNADDHKQSTPPPHTRIWAPSGPTQLPLPAGNKSQFTKTQNLQKKTWKHTKTDFGPFPWAVNMPWTTALDLGIHACSYTHYPHTLHAQITHRNSK